MLGHSWITRDTYANVLPELAKEAAGAAAKLVPRKITIPPAHTSLTQAL
jgi:hypothetical protein